jgi:ParB-like chromosome segregation protein Spo0J
MVSVSVPIVKSAEFSTNPCKRFDEENLDALAESIRTKGLLSPLLARRTNGHFGTGTRAKRCRTAGRLGGN